VTSLAVRGFSGTYDPDRLAAVGMGNNQNSTFDIPTAMNRCSEME
jgi:hypothetical protein